jgi:hypothetical protein
MRNSRKWAEIWGDGNDRIQSEVLTQDEYLMFLGKSEAFTRRLNGVRKADGRSARLSWDRTKFHSVQGSGPRVEKSA